MRYFGYPRRIASGRQFLCDVARLQVQEIPDRELSPRESCDTLTAARAVYFVALNRFKLVRGIADETGGARDTKHSAGAYPDGDGGLHAKRAIEYTVEHHAAAGEGRARRWLAETRREFPGRICRLPRVAP